MIMLIVLQLNMQTKFALSLLMPNLKNSLQNKFKNPVAQSHKVIVKVYSEMTFQRAKSHAIYIVKRTFSINQNPI